MRLPGRQRLGRLVKGARRRFASRGLILMYHRIADLDADPWGLAVSPAHFAEHLAILRRWRSSISLSDLAGALGAEDSSLRPIAVTFDDGYADNVKTALPILEQHDIAATVFLTTGAIGGRREFWWDELERVLLEPRELPPALDLRGIECGHRYELGADARYSNEAYLSNRLWRAWQEPPTARHAVYSDLWRRLYLLPHHQKQAILDDLLSWAGLSPVMRPSHRLISMGEAEQLAHSPLIEVGAHTVTHPALPKLPAVSQTEEIQQSKRSLEAMLGRSIVGFAYPHGDHDAATVSAVREAGFAFACTTAARGVSKRSDCLALPRFQVMDWNGDEFQTRLAEWQRADTST